MKTEGGYTFAFKEGGKQCFGGKSPSGKYEGCGYEEEGKYKS